MKYKNELRKCTEVGGALEIHSQRDTLIIGETNNPQRAVQAPDVPHIRADAVKSQPFCGNASELKLQRQPDDW